MSADRGEGTIGEDDTEGDIEVDWVGKERGGPVFWIEIGNKVGVEEMG